jgi:hypothetical protein
MAVSEVSICNLALQKLGAKRISALDDDSREAESVNACYETLRDRELAAYHWNFAKTRVTLAPDATAPEFTFTYAFLLPADCLNIIKPARLGLDWHVENHNGSLAILTNDGDEIDLRYIAKITDPTRFHPVFVDMLACKIAWHCCEELTQSNTKKDAVAQEYMLARKDARRMNAFSVNQQPQPVDGWLAARNTGQLVNTEWNEE